MNLFHLFESFFPDLIIVIRYLNYHLQNSCRMNFHWFQTFTRIPLFMVHPDIIEFQDYIFFHLHKRFQLNTNYYFFVDIHDFPVEVIQMEYILDHQAHLNTMESKAKLIGNSTHSNHIARVNIIPGSCYLYLNCFAIFFTPSVYDKFLSSNIA